MNDTTDTTKKLHEQMAEVCDDMYASLKKLDQVDSYFRYNVKGQSEFFAEALTTGYDIEDRQTAIVMIGRHEDYKKRLEAVDRLMKDAAHELYRLRNIDWSEFEK